MLDLAKILQGVFLGKNATFPHYYDPFFAKKFFFAKFEYSYNYIFYKNQ